MSIQIAHAQRSRPVTAALMVAGVGAAALIGAWIFQYGFGLQPCALCLEQRIPYYVAVPLGLVVAWVGARGASPRILRAGLVILGALMLVGTGLAIYHAGVEWRWWPGPQDCSGELTGFGKAGNLDDLRNVRVVRCDVAAWRFVGLSLAGYNALISAALAVAAFAALVPRRGDSWRSGSVA